MYTYAVFMAMRDFCRGYPGYMFGTTWTLRVVWLVLQSPSQTPSPPPSLVRRAWERDYSCNVQYTLSFAVLQVYTYPNKEVDIRY